MWKRDRAKTQNNFDALSLLTDDAEELLGAVSGDATGGQVVEAVVDSGAVHSVAPPGFFPGRMVPSPWSRAGRGYLSLIHTPEPTRLRRTSYAVFRLKKKIHTLLLI